MAKNSHYIQYLFLRVVIALPKGGGGALEESQIKRDQLIQEAINSKLGPTLYKSSFIIS